MSWFSKNYEKAALGGAVVVSLGLIYLGYSHLASTEDDFASTVQGQGNSNTAVTGADLIPKAIASAKADRSWNQADDAGRVVDLFTGIPLFVSSSAPDKALDLVKGDILHPPIPNLWWIDNRLDPGFGDSPARDPDEDGFSNLEEFNGKTDPNDGAKYPPLIAKLMYVRDESLTWVVMPGFGSEGSFPFKYVDSKSQENKTGPVGVAPNSLFFEKGPMANRFKLVGNEVRNVMDKRINIEREQTFVRIEDQRANKKGVIYEIPSPLSQERANDHRQYDRTAILSLEAIGKKGVEFKVEENLTFSLPNDSGKDDYKVTKVTPESIEVEYTDAAGAKKTVQISKGSLPNLSE